MKCSKCGKEILPDIEVKNEVLCARCGIYEILENFFTPLQVEEKEGEEQ